MMVYVSCRVNQRKSNLSGGMPSVLLLWRLCMAPTESPEAQDLEKNNTLLTQ